MGSGSFLCFFAAATSTILVPALACAQNLPAEGPVPTSTVVWRESRAETPLTPQTLTLQVNGHATAIESVRPVTSEGAELAILIDDGLRASMALQLKDLAAFINALPPNFRVLVGYMQNGGVHSEGGFTSEHAAAAAHLRIPFSSPGMSASPYFCLSDFAKHWPSQNRAARFVLMITNGVDPYNGSTSVLNQDSPYVQAAQNDAMRAGIAVYALYYGDVGMRGRSASFSGQSYLSQVADATGGESLYTGTFSPPSFAPYLHTLGQRLRESYVLGFQANATHERADTLTPIKVRSAAGEKIHAPQAVHPGVVE